MAGRTVIGAVATVAVFAALAGAAPSSARAAATCTWGGTPDDPTGVTTNHPGLTNLPAPRALEFHATGRLAGDCRGKLSFTGQMNAGSTCGFITFQGTTEGLPGVARFAGVSAMGIAPARLYDRRGNVVGSENAQFLMKTPVADCATPEGLSRVSFSSVIELFR